MTNTAIQFDEGCRFWIAPWLGWEEEFGSWEEAIACAQDYINRDFEGLRSKHGYFEPQHLIDVRNA